MLIFTIQMFVARLMYIFTNRFACRCQLPKSYQTDESSKMETSMASILGQKIILTYLKSEHQVELTMKRC